MEKQANCVKNQVSTSMCLHFPTRQRHSEEYAAAGGGERGCAQKPSTLASKRRRDSNSAAKRGSSRGGVQGRELDANEDNRLGVWRGAINQYDLLSAKYFVVRICFGSMPYIRVNIFFVQSFVST